MILTLKEILKNLILKKCYFKEKEAVKHFGDAKEVGSIPNTATAPRFNGRAAVFNKMECLEYNT